MTAPGGVIATVYVDVLPTIRDFSRQLRRQLRAASGDLRRLDRDLEPVTRGIAAIGQVATGIVPGVRLARTSLLALGGHAVVGGLLASAAAAGTLQGAMLTMPAISVASAAAMGTLSVGLYGVSDAMKQFFKDEEKFHDKVADLSTNAQATLNAIDGLRDKIIEFRESVQDRLFAGMDVIIQDLAGTFLPILTEHFGNLADVINGGARDLASFAQSADTLADVDTVTRNVEAGFQVLRLAIVPAASALRDIVTVGSQFLPVLAGEVVLLAQEFSRWIAQLRASGALSEFIRNGISNFLQLIEIVKNLGRIVMSVLGAAEESGNGLLDTLERLTARAAEFVQTVRAQEGIGNFLDSAREAGEALLPVLLSLGDLFFNHIVPVLELVAKAVGPAVAEFFDALGNALDVAAPGIEAFARGFAEFIRGIIPALPAVARFIGALGQLVGVLAGELGPIIASIVTAIANVLVPVLDALAAVFLFLNDDVLKFVVVVGTVIAIVSGLVAAIRGVMIVVSLFAAAFQVLSTALIGTQRAASGVAGFLGGPWGIVLGVAAIALGLFSSSSDDAAQEQDRLRGVASELNDVIREQNGIINKNVREKAALQLEEEGVLDLAERAGVAVNKVTDAYVNQGSSLDDLLAQLDRVIAANTIVTTDAEGVTNTVYNDQALAAIELRDKVLGLVDARNADAAATNRQAQATATALGPLEGYRAAMDGIRSVVDQLWQAQNRLQQQQLELLNSEIAYFNQLERTREELTNGSKSLDIHTQAGRDNLASLSQLAQAGLARIQDLKDQNASTQAVADATTQLQNDLIALVQPFFANRDAAVAFLTQLGLFPPSVNITFYTNLPAILQQIRNIASAIGAISGNIFNIGGRARGGPVRAGEWTVVGEEGPELVRWGRAGRVYSNDESERMATRVGDVDRMTTRGDAQRAALAGASSSTMSGGAKIDNHVELRPTVRVYLGDRELTDVVRVVVDQRDRQLQRLVTSNAGVRR